MKQQKKSGKMIPVLLGAGCAVLTAAAVWYDLTYNGGKLVYPMDSYAFAPADIPMLAALALDFLFVVYLVVLLLQRGTAQQRQSRETGRTRRINPKLGLLGLCGFLGFAGFWSYGALDTPAPFCFFVFFGFFGFYFEGKMSDILMDERYKENAARAQQTAYKTGMTIIFLLLILSGHGGAAKLTVAVLMAGISLALALTLFLNDYLLYRYDHDDAAAMEEDQ